ncbi:MAG: PepSY domain-containing protein [Candidatus Omnitrophica bacterium]|nr:PepSY domain-containing protein [Candidatus Omnitrophota bacterium]
MKIALITFVLLLSSSLGFADTTEPKTAISKEQAVEIVKNSLKGPNSDPNDYSYDVTFRTADESRSWLTNPHNNPTGGPIHDQWVVTIKTKDPWKYYSWVDAQTGQIDCRNGDE